MNMENYKIPEEVLKAQIESITANAQRRKPIKYNDCSKLPGNDR